MDRNPRPVEEFHSIQRVATIADEEDKFSEASCSFESEKGFYSLYFKGVSEMRPWKSKLGLSASAIGVIVRKPEGEILLEVQKKLGYYVNEIVAEHLALIEGLVAALEQGVVRIHAFTGSEVLYNQVARGRSLENQLLWAVRERVLDYVRRLDDFMLTFNADSADGRNVMFMAREAIYPSSIPRSVVALHAEDDEDDVVLSCGLGQKSQRSYRQGRFHAPAWYDLFLYPLLSPNCMKFLLVVVKSFYGISPNTLTSFHFYGPFWHLEVPMVLPGGSD